MPEVTRDRRRAAPTPKTMPLVLLGRQPRRHRPPRPPRHPAMHPLPPRRQPLLLLALLRPPAPAPAMAARPRLALPARPGRAALKPAAQVAAIPAMRRSPSARKARKRKVPLSPPRRTRRSKGKQPKMPWTKRCPPSCRLCGPLSSWTSTAQSKRPAASCSRISLYLGKFESGVRRLFSACLRSSEKRGSRQLRLRGIQQ
mmetsp:Transcript_149934/g.481777  ORF Transcript_149934/g.481777 Transcript_149934/m.481777 type:complete len:200 (+) Transcript_149934:2088-2687(+)